MNAVVSLSPKWLDALSLSERIALLDDCAKVTDTGEKRFNQWREDLKDLSDDRFEQRLSEWGLTQTAFKKILSGDYMYFQRNLDQVPEWLASIEQAFSQNDASIELPFPQELEGKKGVGFVAIAGPLIRLALERLHQKTKSLIEAKPDLPFVPGSPGPMFFKALLRPLGEITGRTLVQEMHIARLQGKITGETPQERFSQFMTMLENPDTALSIMELYPVMARLLHQTISRWECFCDEALEHLAFDWEEIKQHFFAGQSPGNLTAFDFSAGDTHRGGRSVAILAFSSGARLVYKPRSLQIEIQFQKLLEWLNEHNSALPFRILDILDRGDYGWVEHVSAKPCVSKEQVTRFYHRQGAFLALLYAVEATDFHYENLIACGEHPVLIDLESLFQPRFGGGEVGIDAVNVAAQKMTFSVVRIGLLPAKHWTAENKEGIDLSGIGNRGGQLTPNNVPAWDGLGTDEMRFIRKRQPLAGAKNQPTLNGEHVNALHYTDAIVQGFSDTYRTLLSNRKTLLAKDGPIKAFEDIEIRVIFRGTRAYTVLHQESFHPDLMGSALERERHFDKLRILAEGSSFYDRIASFEHEEMLEGDVPLFVTQTQKRGVYSSKGVYIGELLDESGIGAAIKHIGTMSETDLQKQIWFIKASMTALAMGGENHQMPSYKVSKRQEFASRERILQAAEKLGDRLVSLAIMGEEKDASWIGLNLLPDESWALTPVEFDLYNGHAGLILTLARLGKITGKSRFTDMAKAGLRSLKRHIDEPNRDRATIGAFNGWAGVIYVYMHLSHLLDEPELLNDVTVLLDNISGRIADDKDLDLFSGCAGALVVMLGLHDLTGSQKSLDLAISCGNRLLETAKPMEQGVGWVLPGVSQKPLTGISHGNAGIAMALAELSSKTGRVDFGKAAKEALVYERAAFCEKEQNWPDFRANFSASVKVDQSKRHFVLAWCHGAVGIGLSRLRILPHMMDPSLIIEIQNALNKTLASGFGNNFSLCHGDLGNLELILRASLALEDAELKKKTDQLTSRILDGMEENGWLCGVPLGVETPGYMNGLAGICDMLLRLAEPQKVPSVLTLDPPPVKLSTKN